MSAQHAWQLCPALSQQGAAQGRYCRSCASLGSCRPTWPSASATQPGRWPTSARPCARGAPPRPATPNGAELGSLSSAGVRGCERALSAQAEPQLVGSGWWRCLRHALLAAAGQFLPLRSSAAPAVVAITRAEGSDPARQQDEVAAGCLPVAAASAGACQGRAVTQMPVQTWGPWGKTPAWALPSSRAAQRPPTPRAGQPRLTGQVRPRTTPLALRGRMLKVRWAPLGLRGCVRGL